MESNEASVLQTVRSKRCRRDSEDSGEAESERPDVDLYQLQVQKACATPVQKVFQGYNFQGCQRYCISSFVCVTILLPEKEVYQVFQGVYPLFVCVTLAFLEIFKSAIKTPIT